MPSFRSVFIAVFIGGALIVAAFLVNAMRPEIETRRPTSEAVRATGKCAECHREETGAIVTEYEHSAHAAHGVTCLDCHGAVEGQLPIQHRDFTIAGRVTPKNCAQCHADEEREFLRSRHAAPAFAAIRGAEPFTQEQIDQAERYHPGAVKRPPNALANLEGQEAIGAGCESCHGVGRPNKDGSIGDCTKCHARHQTSVALARLPRTCGQCHMGPDHSQIEIYEESKHGVLFEAQRNQIDLETPPKELTAEDMPVPTCATCHMSGIGANEVTHDVGERLSYWLFAAISERRPDYLAAQDEMKGVCLTCHTEGHIDDFYKQAEATVATTNRKVAAAKALMDSLYSEKLLTPAPFDEPLEFTYFDLWHYYGRTAKHGAFMGGADFVQWHGNYELLDKLVEMRKEAADLRAQR